MHMHSTDPLVSALASVVAPAVKQATRYDPRRAYDVQSRERMRLSTAWSNNYGGLPPPELAARTWELEHADEINSIPELARLRGTPQFRQYMSYFARNPGAWAEFTGGVGRFAAPAAPTPAIPAAPVAPAPVATVPVAPAAPVRAAPASVAPVRAVAAPAAPAAPTPAAPTPVAPAPVAPVAPATPVRAATAPATSVSAVPGPEFFAASARAPARAPAGARHRGFYYRNKYGGLTTTSGYIVDGVAYDSHGQIMRGVQPLTYRGEPITGSAPDDAVVYAPPQPTAPAAPATPIAPAASPPGRGLLQGGPAPRRIQGAQLDRSRLPGWKLRHPQDGGTTPAGAAKSAQYTGAASFDDPDWLARSVAEAEAIRRRDAAAAARQKAKADRYATLSDEKRMELEAQDRAKAWDEYAKTLPIVQRKDTDTIRREMDARGSGRSWGDNKYMRNLIGGLTVLPRALVHVPGSLNLIGQSRWWEGRNPLAGQLDYWRQFKADGNDMAHDSANGAQLFFGNAVKGADNLRRFLFKWGDPRSWGSGIDARLNRLSHDNDRANADAAHKEWEDRIVRNYADQDLADPNTTMGKWNRGAQHHVGQLAGEYAATAGLGAAAKGVGTGIVKGTTTWANAVRGTSAGANVATREVALPPSLLGRIHNTISYARHYPGQQFRNMLAGGIDATGRTIAAPFNVAGLAAAPATNTAKAARTVAADIGRTFSGIARPGMDMYRFARNPAYRQAALAYAKAHPWRAAAYLPRRAWDIAYPLGRHPVGLVFGRRGLYPMMSTGVYGPAVSGDLRGAAGGLGDAFAMGSFGSLYTPVWLYHLYNGLRNGGEGEN